MSSEVKNDIKVTVENGVKELVIRTGQAKKEIVYEYRGYEVSDASIAAVFEYLEKKDIDEENILNSFVEFSYEDLFLNLKYSVRLGLEDIIKGKLTLHPDLVKWGINNNKSYSNRELASLIKMNRHYFSDKTEHGKLVSALQNLEVKTENELNKQDNRLGNMRQVVAQRVIESNIPASFELNIPIFVGEERTKFAVEIEVNASDFSCVLISPDLKEFIDAAAHKLIGEQIQKIKDLYPQLRIFQK